MPDTNTFFRDRAKMRELIATNIFVRVCNLKHRSFRNAIPISKTLGRTSLQNLHYYRTIFTEMAQSLETLLLFLPPRSRSDNGLTFAWQRRQIEILILFIQACVCARQFHRQRLSCERCIARPRIVNVPPGFLLAQLETAPTHRNILCQCPFGNGNDNVPHIVVVFI